MRVLLVEDEPELAEMARDLLRKENYVVDTAPDLAYAKASLADNDYNLILVDRMLPDGDGVDLVRYCRSRGLQNRFLILSALSDMDDVVEGLDLGADDYVTKPYEPRELLARVRAMLRRPRPQSQVRWSCGALEFDRDTRSATIHGEPVTFSRRELSIVETLIRSAGRVVLRDHMENAVFGYDEEISSNTLESHISRIRKTLDTTNAGIGIHVVRGVGYLMKPVS